METSSRSKVLALAVWIRFLLRSDYQLSRYWMEALGACAGSMQGTCTTQWPWRTPCCG